MGEVYRAKDKRLRRTVALKVLTPQLARSPGLQQRLEREATAISSLNHPHPLLFATLDNLIAHDRVPVMIAISVGNGSGDAQGSERGLEYDTMSGRYADFVETSCCPSSFWRQ